MSVKAGVIGVGYLGRHHARIYSELEGVELAAVVDRDLSIAEEIAAKYGARAYTDYVRAIEGLQAVSIVTPTPMHFDIALACMRAGCDVLVEKPITLTVDEAERLVNEADKLGRILQVGHLERYNPAFIAISKMIDGLKFVESERVSPFLERAAGVDVTLDLMIHDIDIVMSLVNGAGIKDINVVGAKVLSGKVDVAKAWIEFDGGVSALITANRLSGQKRRVLKVFQRDSYLVLDYQKKSIQKYFKGPDGISSESIDIEDKEPLKEEISDFLDCVVTRRRPIVSGIEGMNALKVAIDITEKINGKSGTENT